VGQASLHELILDASDSLSVPANAWQLNGKQGGDEPFSVSELVSDAEHDALMQAGPRRMPKICIVVQCAALLAAGLTAGVLLRRWRGSSTRRSTGGRRRSCTPQSWHSWRNGRLDCTYDTRAALDKLCIPASLSPENSCMSAGSQCEHALSMTSYERRAVSLRMHLHWPARRRSHAAEHALMYAAQSRSQRHPALMPVISPTWH